MPGLPSPNRQQQSAAIYTRPLTNPYQNGNDEDLPTEVDNLRFGSTETTHQPWDSSQQLTPLEPNHHHDAEPMPEQNAKRRSVHHNDSNMNHNSSHDTNLAQEETTRMEEEAVALSRPAQSTRRTSVLSGGSRLPRKSATHLLLYTRAVPLPKRFETITEYRFLMRMTQIFMAGAAFASLATASFNVNYTSAVLAVSGINFMTFTSISSLFVSFGCILVYCFPAFVGVAPHRHPRFSRVEVVVDLVYLGCWLAAPSLLVWYGRCPRLTFSTAPDAISCLPWNMCTAFGFAAAALFLGTALMGLKDLGRYGLFSTGRGNGVMWARGSWKEWAET
ncbi:hypothetical protein PhCBS80983_g03319 [Powellomyces hirtus]|uniref:Uncharacterized protein n=1 Tax=Powellomyces hirtus TaxID=109895 RepID=A0A507E2W5_9FUNG|nr:hypothetical protein PhCBS80983_g03319 [Powellomyces hirtus]